MLNEIFQRNFDKYKTSALNAKVIVFQDQLPSCRSL